MADNHQKSNEQGLAETPARELLTKLGYQYIPRQQLAGERNDERELLLRDRLLAALQRLNPWLTQDQARRAIFKLEQINAVGMTRNQTIHEYLTYGMPLDVDDSTGRHTRTVRFFDFDRPRPEDGHNEYIVTTQMRIRKANERDGGQEDDERLVIPDLVLFVNGIPLVVIEAKSPTLGDVWRARAVRQLLRYQEARPEFRGRGTPELFDYNLMCVAIADKAAAYGAIGAGESGYAAWKSLAPFTPEQVQAQFGVQPQGQAQLIVGLLAPATLMDILRDFVIYEPEHGQLVKKLPRYQQYRAVTAAMERILGETEPAKRGGVVWHTQGSGKSLTMVWMATKLRREPRLKNPTIVVVTDRTQLDEQIAGTFRRVGYPSPERVVSTAALREALTNSVGRTVMTTIQKFDEALTPPGGTLALLNDADNIFVMVDEAHRTQYGLLGAKMERALPGATFIGFTGTPIDKGFRRSTMRRFGPLIDKYTIPEAVEDGATVEIRYEVRLPDLAIQGASTLDRMMDILTKDMTPEERAVARRRYANKQALAEAEQRIQKIAEDIALHFDQHVRPNGFKAQVVAPSRRTALKYAEKLQDLGINAVPVITYGQDDEADILDAMRKLAPQKTIIEDFTNPDGKIEVLVVVDMLLTGFDAPIEQVLYLDRSLREHGLLQAIARVNRRFTLVRKGVTTEKTYGLVVDYWGVSQELDTALSQFEEEDRAQAWKELEEDPEPKLEAAARDAEAIFAGKDLADVWTCVAVFAPGKDTDGDFRADLYEDFNRKYREFSKLLDQFLPDQRALDYTDRLARLTIIRAYVRATYLREDTTVDWDAISAKVRRWIDERITAEVQELMQPVSILDADFAARINAVTHDSARASVMEHAIRAHIKDHYNENPALYEKLSEQLQRVIDAIRQQVLDAATVIQDLGKLREQTLSVGELGASHGMSTDAFAVYKLLEQETTADEGIGTVAGGGASPLANGISLNGGPIDEQLKSVALSIEQVMATGKAIVDWQNKEEVQRVMRRDIKRALNQLDGLTDDQRNALAVKAVGIARASAAR